MVEKAKVVGVRGRGRPLHSKIRQNIIELLACIDSATGYDIYKMYLKAFPACTQRVIYYHLGKGASIGEFDIKRVTAERGNYSWGGVSEKIYYSLGKSAKPRAVAAAKEAVNDFIAKKEAEKKTD